MIGQASDGAGSVSSLGKQPRTANQIAQDLEDLLAPAGAWKRQQLQKELSALSAQGAWVAVPDANHYVQLSKPHAVIEASQRVMNAARPLQPARK